MPNIPYERIVQWLAGPLAIVAGVIATKLTANLHWLGQLGLGKNEIAHAIVAAVTFVTGAGLTYAAHHKWLSNLPRWWDSQALGQASPINFGKDSQGDAADVEPMIPYQPIETWRPVSAMDAQRDADVEPVAATEAGGEPPTAEVAA